MFFYVKNFLIPFTLLNIKNIIYIVSIEGESMRVSGITYVKRKKGWFSKLLLVLLIIIILFIIFSYIIYNYTDLNIPIIEQFFSIFENSQN